MTSPGLKIDQVTKTLGGREIIRNLSLEVKAGELICLLGPSGCGKTTTLRMLGGFISPDAGRILIGGVDVTHLPPERRPTSMVFQNYALWPHMTVFNNVAYGLKLKKLSKARIREKVEEVLALVKLTHHIDTPPGRISGGEQQRVALARALVLEPQVLLLDEPLSNLDAKLRERVRDDIRDIQQRVGITTVLVTHDQDEALSVADRIAVMNRGEVEQYSDAKSLYREPQTRFVADFVGTMNLFRGQAAGTELVLAPDGLRVPCAELSGAGGGDWEIGVRPEDVEVSLSGDGAPARVVRQVPRGHYTELALMLGSLPLRAFVSTALAPEGEVKVRFARGLLYRDGALHRSGQEPR